MPNRFFITGTDTGVGKTMTSALLCAALDATYWKPIQTGSREGTDRNAVMQLAQLPRNRALPETYCFAPPVSPHLASSLARVRIDLRKIRIPQLAATGSLIVEGAGGVLVPLNDRQLMTHLMKHLKLPVLLVSRTSLGTINHTLLSLTSLRDAELDMRGVVMVGKPNRDNRNAIEHYGNVQVIGTIPVLPRINRGMLLEIFRKYFDRQVFSA